MKNEFIPYEEALALKELGFDYSCFGYHIEDFGEGIGFNKKYTPSQNHHPYQSCSAPLYQQAFRWFRKKYNFVGTPLGDGFNGQLKGYYYSITEEGWINYYESIDDSKWYDTYEEAELACLRKLIEIVKQNKENENNNQ
tara:strand:+ start:247 stop:663 length:417 start_codon:yes stop_codon:yes gene_type:complete